jgi:hypothetical protein
MLSYRNANFLMWQEQAKNCRSTRILAEPLPIRLPARRRPSLTVSQRGLAQNVWHKRLT